MCLQKNALRLAELCFGAIFVCAFFQKDFAIDWKSFVSNLRGSFQCNQQHQFLSSSLSRSISLCVCLCVFLRFQEIPNCVPVAHASTVFLNYEKGIFSFRCSILLPSLLLHAYELFSRFTHRHKQSVHVFFFSLRFKRRILVSFSFRSLLLSPYKRND